MLTEKLNESFRNYGYKDEIEVLLEKDIEPLNMCLSGDEKGKLDVDDDMLNFVSSGLLLKINHEEEPYEIVNSGEIIDIAVRYGAVLQYDQLCHTHQKYGSLDGARYVRLDCRYVRDVAFTKE